MQRILPPRKEHHRAWIISPDQAKYMTLVVSG